MLKAASDRFEDRFREIISDPLNHLIHRCADAGDVDADNNVMLHNGLRVPLSGPHSYYGDFSRILHLNRGVHEPLEEFCFQQVLHAPVPDGEQPIMIELGAYWAHYSRWFKSRMPDGRCIMVEPETRNLEAGRHAFQQAGYDGTFVQALVGPGDFVVDDYMDANGIDRLHILHSDIQGAEVGMLAGAARCLSAHRACYVFVSTHGQALHHDCEAALRGHGYRIEASSDFEHHSTSHDGFMLASSPEVEPIFEPFQPLGRTDLETATPAQIVDYLAQVKASCRMGLG